MSLLMSSTLSAPAEFSSSADCDDITADVIIVDSRSCTSSQLVIVMTSFLLLIAFSRICADVVTADSRFIFASIQQLIAFLHTSARLQIFIFFFDISSSRLHSSCSSWFIFSLALAAGSYRSSWFIMLQLVQLDLRLITNN
ncbi:hypothetical protein F511_41417 [Dorcoceras hygrometricum]|uniref:Uncharacterized protein n=1 Tax=Dorcoceras hygrometricum TaxID=472368 RepID=A0A2Z7AU10_9LAMI|nr:hypothetical protein F511_41417 [Dorcoceras hygrometricum]